MSERDQDDKQQDQDEAQRSPTTATIDAVKLIKEAYKKRYPDWGDVNVSAGARAFDGQLFVVRPESAEDDDGEVCFFSRSGVRIFGSTEDLVDFLETKANSPLLERISSRSFVTALVFVLLVIGVFTAGFFKDYFDHQVLMILGNVLGVAAGFFFGQSFAKETAR